MKILSQERALQLIQESISGLFRVGLIQEEVHVNGETAILGGGSLLDSVAFVTFLTDLEDRMNKELERDIFLILNDLHELNAGKAQLSAGTLVTYLTQLAQSAGA